MSLRDDIEALTAVFRNLSRAHDRSSNTSGGTSSAQRDMSAVAAADKRRQRFLDFNSNPTPLSDVSISAISVAQEEEDEDEEEHKNGAMKEVIPLKTSSILRGPKEDDDTLAAPPSSNTTGLPCTDSAPIFSQPRDGPGGGLQAPTFLQSMTSRTSSAVLLKNDGKGPSAFSTGVDDTACVRINSSNPAFASSDSSAVSMDLQGVEAGSAHVEGVYKNLARKLLMEIERLDARTAAVSAQCEGERQEWVRAQHELQQQIMERDALIGTLRQRLMKMPVDPDMARGCWRSGPTALAYPSAREKTRSVSNEPTTTGSWSDSCGRTRAAVPLNHSPSVQGEACFMSSSSAVEVKSPPALRRMSDASEKREFNTPAHTRTAEEDVTSTRAHSLTEFLQRKFSSLRPALPSEDAALRECSTTAAPPVRKKTPLRGSPNPVFHTEAGDDAIYKRRAKTKTVPSKRMICAGLNGNKRDIEGADLFKSIRIPPPSPQHCLSEVCRGQEMHSPTESSCCERTRYRRKNRMSSRIFSSGAKQKCGGNAESDRWKSRSCRPCCRDQASTVAHTIPAAAHRGQSCGVHCEPRATRRCLHSALSGAKCGKRKIVREPTECIDVLHDLLTRSTMMEGHLADLRHRLEKQETGLQDVTHILHDVVLPLTSGSLSTDGRFPSRCVSPQKQGTKT